MGKSLPSRDKDKVLKELTTQAEALRKNGREVLAKEVEQKIARIKRRAAKGESEAQP